MYISPHTTIDLTSLTKKKKSKNLQPVVWWSQDDEKYGKMLFCK